MRFGKWREARYEQRRAKVMEGGWRCWFAWRPVRMKWTKFDWRWLEWVERADHVDAMGFWTEYRPLTAE